MARAVDSRGAQTMLLRSLSIASLGGSSSMQAYALCNVLFSIAHAAARVLLLWGIVRLAQPPSR